MKPPEKNEVPVEKYEGESDREQFEDDQKVCCGFFFKVRAATQLPLKGTFLIQIQRFSDDFPLKSKEIVLQS